MRIATRMALAALLASLAIAPACTTGGTTGQPFTMLFTDFGVHMGHTFYLRVLQASNEALVGMSVPFTVNAASFNVTIPNAIQPSTAYLVEFWADVDGNGELDGTPLNGGTDHAWQVAATSNASGLDLQFAHDTNFMDIRPWDL